MEENNIEKITKELDVIPVATIIASLLLTAASIIYLFYWVGDNISLY